MEFIKKQKEIILSFFNKNFNGKEIIAFSILSLISFIGVLIFLNFLLQKTWIDRVVYKGSVTEGIVGTASHVHIVFGNEETTKSLSNILFSPVAKIDDNDKLILDLAESINYDEKNSTYNIKLKDNIYFHDKSKITTDDIIYTYNLAKNSEYTKFYKNIIENLEIIKIDNLNLQIKEKKANTKTIQLFRLGIIPKKIYENNESELSFINDNSIGSGAFKIKEIKRDNNGNRTIKSITFERFENGGEKFPYIKNFTIHFFGNSNDAADALFKQEINLITNIDADGLERLKIKNQKLNTQTNPTEKYFALFINQNKNEVLQSKKFRQLLSSSIDRNYLSKNIMKDFGSPKEKLFTDAITTPNASNTNDILASTTLIIAEDGLMYNSKKNKDGKREKTGEQIKLFISTPNVKELTNSAEFIKSEFSRIGVATEINILSNESLAEVLKNRDFEILLFPFNIEHSVDLYNFFHSNERKYPKLNIANYVNKNVDKLTEELKTNISEERRAEILSLIEDEIGNDMPIIILGKQNVVSVFLENDTKIILSNNLQNNEDKYKYLPYWYSETEKIYSFWNFKFLDKLESWIY